MSQTMANRTPPVFKMKIGTLRKKRKTDTETNEKAVFGHIGLANQHLQDESITCILPENLLSFYSCEGSSESRAGTKISLVVG